MKKKLYICKKADAAVTIFVTAVFIVVCVCVLAMPRTSVDGAKSGLEYSFGILIPSLFPFLFLSDFAVEYGISQKLGRVLAPVTEKLFYLPGEAGVTILLSLIGGFPVGASGINALLKQDKITQSQAQRMLFFCVNSGPGFVITVVGAELYGNTLLGVVLLIAQVAASMIIGIVSGIAARRKEPIQHNKFSSKNEKREFAPSFIISCREACTATINLCALVVLFSMLSAIISKICGFSEDSLAFSAINSFLEVTSGCNALAENHMPLFVSSLAIGWGGLSVHFQIFSAASEVKIKKLLFFICRILNGTLSALITFAVMLFIKQDSEVFSNIEDTASSFTSGTFYGSLALFCAGIVFIIFLNTYIRITTDDKCKNKS